MQMQPLREWLNLLNLLELLTTNGCPENDKKGTIRAILGISSLGLA